MLLWLVGRGLSEWRDWRPEALYKRATRPHAPLLPLGGNAGAATYLRHPRKLPFHRACVGGLRVWRELERANRAIRNGHSRFSRNVTHSGRFGQIFEHAQNFATDRQIPSDRQSRPDTPEHPRTCFQFRAIHAANAFFRLPNATNHKISHPALSGAHNRLCMTAALLDAG